MADINFGKEFLFEEFVLSVIKQKCINQRKPFIYDASHWTDEKKVINDNNRNFMTALSKFDGYAPYGFDAFNGPVIIEIKYKPRSSIFRPLDETNKAATLYIISTSEEEAQKRIKGDRVYVWGIETISSWEKTYPIDFYAFYSKGFETDEQADELFDFKIKNENNKELLKQEIEKRRISISLGAGVSIEYGAQKWDDLINDFYDEIQLSGKIDDVKAVQKKIGGTSLINGQFAQDNLLDFMESLYKGLYKKYRGKSYYYADTSLEFIANLAERLQYSKRFNIITYNYDNFLEQILAYRGVEHNSIYNEDGKVDDKLSIFHPHGFMPFGIKKSDYEEYKDFIVFSESEYHKLYNNPLSWAMVLQQYLYRESAYLFVGCSLTDPNLRRILENTKVKGKTHFALMITDGLSKKDQFIVHRHFMRIGVECIWFDTVNDMKSELKKMSN